MSVQELKALARKHWEEWLPQKVADLKAQGKLNEALQGAANLAQTEIEHLMSKKHYSVDEAREVALPQFILLPPEQPAEPDEQDRELAEKEAAYQRNPPPQVMFDREDEGNQGPIEPMSEPAKPSNRDQLIDEAKQTIALKRQEIEKPSEVPIANAALLSADRNKKAVGFKPDYGLRLLKDGYSLAIDLYFYEFRLFSISVIGNGDYSTMVELRYDGELHALSLDFNHPQLEQILVGADPTLSPPSYEPN